MSKTNISQIDTIAQKVFSNQRITPEEGVFLFENAEIPYLGILANLANERVNGKQVYFNKNAHIEPTNICINKCRFCAYSREKGQEGGWELSLPEIQKRLKDLPENITEIHIVGGIHPDRDLNYYCQLIEMVKQVLPKVCVKAFTAPEIEYMISKAGLSLEDGIRKLKQAGLEAVPGGGAEIFDEKLRAEICPEKTSSENWLKIHETLHKEGIPSNATILYGHRETYTQRIDHLNRLRLLQDQTHGFNAFIPLKFRNENSAMSDIKEVSIIEDLKMYAITRIFLDNVPHLKAYWPSVGKSFAQLALSFGVDDLDGTINDSTKIYSMAGAEDTNPCMTEQEMNELIHEAGKTPVERDSQYRILK